MTLQVRRIVCAIDFSASSAAALRAALALARRHGAELRVIHAYTMPVIPLVESGIVVVDEDRLVASVEQDMGAWIATHGDPSVTPESRAVAGWPADAILRESRRAGADLIVVGTRGLSGLPRFLLGSVAERVARTSAVPVLVVPESSLLDAATPIRTIVCGVDFSEPSVDAMRAGATLAEHHGARLHLVHAWEPSAALGRHPELVTAHEETLERDLASEVARTIPDVETVTRRVLRGVPYEAIVDEARAVRADVVVVGSTGRSGAVHFLLGSVSERVTRVSPVPVLIVRGGR